MKYLKIILFVMFVFVGNHINAQKISTNDNGETIIVFDDGSWRYYEETDEFDQFLMKKHLKALNSKGKKEDITPSKDIQESISKIDVLNDKISNAQISLEDAQDEEQMLKEQIRRYKKLKNKSKVASLKTIFKKKKYEVKRKKKFYKNAKTQLKYYQKEAQKGKKKKRKKKNRKRKIEDDFEMVADTQTDGDNTNSNQETNSSGKNDYAKYSQKDDVKYSPPTFPCGFTNNDNNNTDNLRKQLEPQLLFAYTPASMLATKKNKDEDYIRGVGQISKIKGGNLILDLKITIESENAKNEYGLIEKGSLLALKMIDKSSVTTTSRKTVIGVYNEVDKSVTYEASYNIPSGMVKKLMNIELDFAKLIWSTGYEEYEIFETDFFINQLKCFE